MADASHFSHLSFAAGFPWLRSGTGVFPLPEAARIVARGKDAARFLNGLSSIRFDTLRPGEAKRACILDIKGKTLAAPYCRANPDGCFWLEVPAGLGETVFAHLDRYLIADEVELSLEPSPPCVHLLRPPPGSPDSGTRNPRFGEDGRDFTLEEWVAAKAACPALGELAERTQAETGALRILSATPEWPGEINGKFFPAELGLDKTAVDFHKGCYLGQEVVSRLESVGAARRSLCHFWSAEAVPQTGDALVCPDTGKEVGVVCSVCPAEDGGAFGLAVARIEHLVSGKILRLFHASQNAPGAVEIQLFPKL